MIDGDVINLIAIDAMNGISPEDSELDYNEEMLKFRKNVEADIKKMPPKTMIELPFNP